MVIKKASERAIDRNIFNAAVAVIEEDLNDLPLEASVRGFKYEYIEDVINSYEGQVKAIGKHLIKSYQGQGYHVEEMGGEIGFTLSW